MAGERIMCQCGGVYYLNNKSTHNASKRHKNYLVIGTTRPSKEEIRVSRNAKRQLKVECPTCQKSLARNSLRYHINTQHTP